MKQLSQPQKGEDLPEQTHSIPSMEHFRILLGNGRMLIVLLPEAEAEAKSTLSGALDRHADRNPSLQFIRHRTPSPVQWKAELKATHSGLQWESTNWLVSRNSCKHLLLGAGRARSTCHSTRVGVRRQLLEFNYQLAPRSSDHQAWLQAPLPTEPYHQPLSEIF